VTISAKGRYLARLQMGSSLYSFLGQFDGAGVASNTVSVLGQSPLALQLEFAQGDPPVLTGNVGNETWTAGVTAYESVFNARTNPAPFAGRYTLIMSSPGDGNLQEPQGNGYGTVTVSTSGQLIFSGTLADGTVLSQVTTISADGQWPLYASLYAGRGQVLAWVNFANLAQSDFSGELSWIKLPVAFTRNYPGGFGVSSAIQGSRFVPGTIQAPVLNFTNGLITLTGANLPATVTDGFTVEAGERTVGTDHVILNFSSATGLFTGDVPNPIAGQPPLFFRGIFLTKPNYGAGFFISGNLSGPVSLGP
jgi:hypothetical protein